MTPTKLKAAGYVRVSTSGQTEGESLATQRQSIKAYCKANGYKLTEIYADEGISGGSVSERPGLLQCLYDAQNGKFDTLVIHRLSRFGRNARELLNNQEELNSAGIQLRSVSEGIDFGNKYGKAMLGMLAVIAELEKDVIRDQFLENRISAAKKGIPTAGRLPFGRTFDKETGKWELDEEMARLLRWAADEYLKGGSFLDIADTLKSRYDFDISHRYLITVLKERCGDKWEIQFDGEEPIEYTIPRILPEDTIQAIKDRLAHNRVSTRPDVKKYPLSGFIRCEKCHLGLSGQTQTTRHGKVFEYYRHPTGRQFDCKAFSSVPVGQIEKAVFETIFENIADVPNFEKAIADSLPDEKLIRSLEKQIKAGEKQLRKVDKGLETLVDAVLSGSLKKETIQAKETALLQEKEKLANELDDLRHRLSSLPDPEEVKQEADHIRRNLLRRYSGKDRLREMTYDDKVQLLHWLFDGKDPDGVRYGIYVNKEKGIRGKIDYFMYGRITGLRTVKGDNIDWFPGDDPDGGDSGGGSTSNKEYKTSNGSFNKKYKSYTVGFRVKSKT